MKLVETNKEELKNKIVEKLNETEDKSMAIADALDMYFSEKYSGMIDELKEQSKLAESDKDYAKKLGLRTLSKKEEEFYESLKDIKQAVTTNQIDAIPNSIIDITQNEIRKESKVLGKINFAPADVKRWYTASKTGAFAWKKLTAAYDRAKDLSATFSVLNNELGKLYVLIIIPKSIRDLSYQFIDKYFTAVLNEQLRDGQEYGFFVGDGDEMPIGIYKQIGATDNNGKHTDKAVNTDIVNFTPNGLKGPKVALTNNGTRTLDSITLFCNPLDKANYVDPAILNDRGDNISSMKNIDIVESTQNPQGKAALFLDGHYTMGISKIKVDEYKETLALEDADLLIGNAYANGRATDDAVAYVFDVTKLEEYVEKVKVVNAADFNDGEGV